MTGKITYEDRVKTVVLCLGNDILGDDGVGIEAARLLRDRVRGGTEVKESSEAGLALLELLEGYDSALILDSVMTGLRSPGVILEMSRDDFRKITAPSPHYAGLPEVLAMAEALDLRFPREIRILAMEVADPHVIREGLSTEVAAALPAFVDRAVQMLAEGADARGGGPDRDH